MHKVHNKRQSVYFMMLCYIFLKKIFVFTCAVLNIWIQIWSGNVMVTMTMKPHRRSSRKFTFLFAQRQSLKTLLRNLSSTLQSIQMYLRVVYCLGATRRSYCNIVSKKPLIMEYKKSRLKYFSCKNDILIVCGRCG